MKSTPLMVILGSIVLFVGLVACVYFYSNKETPTEPQVDRQVSTKKTASRPGFSNFLGAPETSGRPGNSPIIYGVDLNGLTVGQYVKGFYDAANKGDKEAAFNIYRAETICARIPFQKQLLREMSVTTDSAVVASVSKQIKDAESVCVDFNTNLKERLDYLSIAANGGAAPAQVAVASEPLEAIDPKRELAQADLPATQWEKDMVVRYLTGAATQGDTNALQTLSKFYEEGKIAPQNFQMALAYEIAAVQLLSANQNTEDFNSPAIDRLSSRMTSSQINSAKTAANQIVSDCCNKD